MRVSMPSRAYTSLLRNIMYLVAVLKGQLCQCPLGLIPHCYERWRELKESQLKCVNALSGLYLIVTRCMESTGLMPMRTRTVSSHWQVSMPSRAYTSLLQYPFKNLGFMRFPEPIFAGICQNILIITHFHAC